MDVIFLKLFNRSIAAGWLILALILLRPLLRKAPKRLSCVLWAAVAVRLVCPFSLESAFSLIPSAEPVSPKVVRYAQEPAIDSGVLAIDDALNPMIRKHFTPAPGASVNPLYIWVMLASFVWIAGLTIMLGYALISYLRIWRKVRESAPLRDNIRLCDAVRSPFILGIVRPRIYLPSGMHEKQALYALAHEQAHLRRGDHFWKFFAYVLLAVYWYHPLVWAAYILFCRDVEFACDEKAVRDMDFDGKKAYCQALLACSMPEKGKLSCPPAFGDGSVKRRVRHVLYDKNPAFWLAAAAVVAGAAVAVCFLTDPKKDSRDEPEEAQSVGRSEVYEPEETQTVGRSEAYEPEEAQSVVHSEAYELDSAEPDRQSVFDDFGISIELPGNENWIQNREDRRTAENTMEISYYDAIAEADCKLQAVKDGSLELPEDVYAPSLEVTWEGRSKSGELVKVRVQRSDDGKKASATWTYGAYRFAILADVLREDAMEADIGSIPKTALSIISNL